MIKKSTLIVLLVAVIIGAAAYYFDWKRGQKEAANAPADSTKPAFTLQADDISALTISYHHCREFCSNSRLCASHKPNPARPIVSKCLGWILQTSRLIFK
jgi:hypothetical protein